MARSRAGDEETEAQARVSSRETECFAGLFFESVLRQLEASNHSLLIRPGYFAAGSWKREGDFPGGGDFAKHEVTSLSAIGENLN